MQKAPRGLALGNFRRKSAAFAELRNTPNSQERIREMACMRLSTFLLFRPYLLFLPCTPRRTWGRYRVPYRYGGVPDAI
jgi:hypothetical protein